MQHITHCNKYVDKTFCPPTLHIQDPISLDDADISDIMTNTDDIITAHGPRLAGTDADKAAGEEIFNQFQKSCDHAHKDSFRFARNAFLSFMKILAVTFFISFGSFLLGGYWVIIGLIVSAFGSVFAIEEFVLYHHTFDWLYKHYTGHNIYGTIDPTEDVQKKIIISAHHDSAYEFNFFKKHQKMYGPRIFTGLVLYHALGIALSLPLIIGIDTFNQSPLRLIIFILYLIGLPIVGAFYFFRSNKGTPGAGDNLVAVSLLMKLAEKYGELKQRGKGLKHTQIVFLSHDAEECGIRGSEAFVKAHLDELKAIPTYVLNLESIYSLKHLSLLSQDINQTIPLSPELTTLCHETAKELGYDLPIKPIAWGGGSTDAGAFGKAGITATTILGMENATIRDGLVYHTEHDTIDKVEPAGLKATSRILIRMIGLLGN